jgi:hypothetical protein
MLTPWKAAAVAITAGLLAASSASAGDLFRMAHGGYGPYQRASWGGRGYCPNPWRCYPGLNLGIGLPWPVPDYANAPPPELSINAPPVYQYTTPNYPAPGALNVTTYSTPNGAATYSVTQPVPAPSSPEVVVPPVPHDGAPPPPKGNPTMAPGHFHIAPLQQLRVSLPARAEDRATIRIGNP